MVKGTIEAGGNIVIPGELKSILKVDTNDEVEITKNCAGGVTITKTTKTKIPKKDTVKIPAPLMKKLKYKVGDNVNIVEMECGEGIKINKI